MKSAIQALATTLAAIGILASTSAFAATSKKSILENCFSGRPAEFFAYELETIVQDGNTALMLLNEAREVVGYVSVKIERDAKKPRVVTAVQVQKLELCASLETSDFYYTDGAAADVLTWLQLGEISITQDEGMIVMKPSIEKVESYATLLKLEFNAYDVFTEDPAAEIDQPDYVEDWGAPKGRGSVYLYIPKNWILKK